MNNKILIIITLLFLIALPLTLADYEDTFTDTAGTNMNDYLNWSETATSGTADIIVNPSVGGDTVGEISRLSLGIANFIKLSLSGESNAITSDTDVVEADFYFDQSGTASTYELRFVLEQTDASQNVYTQFIRNGAGWDWYNVGDTTTIVSGFSDDTWHTMKIYPNLTSDTFTAELDGTTYDNGGAGFSFNAVATSLNQLNFYDKQNQISQILINNLCVGECTTTPSVTYNNFSTLETGSFAFNTPVIIGSSYGIINSISLTVDNTDIPYYFASSFTTYGSSNQNANAICKLVHDTTDLVSGERSITQGDYGNFKLISDPVNLSLGNHTITTQCIKDSVKGYTIINSEMATFNLIDDNINSTIEWLNVNDSVGFSVSTVDTLLDSFSFNTTNTTNTTNVNNVVIHFRSSYSYSVDSDITTYIRLEETGETCGNYTRGGSGGSTGSLGSTCVFENLNSSTSYNFSINGFTSVGNSNIVDLLLNVYEIKVNETAISTTSLNKVIPAGVITEIDSINISNVLGGSYNVFVDGGLMVNTSTSQQAYFYIKNSETSINYTRTINSLLGNVNTQHVFSESGTGINTYSLMAYCPSGCEVVSGDLSAFVTDSDSVSTGVFNITAYNFYNDTEIIVFNATIGGTTLTTTNGIVTAIGQDSVNVLVEANNFFSNTTLQDTTINHNASLVKYVEIRAKDFFGITINSYSLNDSSNTYTTTNDIIYLPVSINAIYSFSSTGFATTSETVTPTQFYNFTGFTENSISFTFYDFDTGSIITNPILINMLGSSITYDLNTSTGTLYSEGLNDDTYTTTFSSGGYSDQVLFLTLASNDHLTVNVYLQKSLSAVDFIVKDSNLVPIDGAVLTFSTIINGTSIVLVQGETDFSGRSSILLDVNLSYTFTSVKNGFDVFAGTINPTEAEYSLTMVKSASSDFITVFDDVTFMPLFNYNVSASFALASFLVNSIDGSLEYFGLSSSYESVNFSKNISGITGGGFPTINITGISDSTASTVNVTYFFKSIGHDEFTFTQTYILSKVNGSNISFTGGLFSEVIGLDDTDPTKPIIGMFIVIILMGLFIGASRNFSIGVMGGLLGTGVNWNLALWSPTISLIVIIVGFVLLIADSAR